MLRISLAFLLSFLCSYSLYAKSFYMIPPELNGLFNYNHKQSRVIFMESFITISPKFSVKNVVYEIDLNKQKLIKKIEIENADGCIYSSPKLDRKGIWLASVNKSKKTFYLQNRTTGKCIKQKYNFTISEFGWSQDSKWLVIKERKRKYFHLLSPNTKEFKHYSHNGYTWFYVWEPHLKTTLFAFRPDKYIQTSRDKTTSDMNDYFYINGNMEWVQYKKNPPLYSKKNKIFFKRVSENEVIPYTEFYHLDTGKKLNKAENYSFKNDNFYSILFNDHTVYFHDSFGLYNYKKNIFTPFANPSGAARVFSIDKERYAIMYNSKEDLLKVYDLEERKFLKNYPPFWRKEH